ncbi:hypothetical protein GLOIN_2v1088893 [Rhizophagus irregularis DAOM 181602=DAOM 197198]|uniref:Crinkler effector protein N-terminal domain-containing protein n=2 Tax=Rhizophagus irregularis (strain DAOM 181602 / DAOM 197198 / MUCL 43194) TaxID=747089 RepID=A0A2P4QWB6_RHIID|nr:hypothetical protein GLOIN_2v1088893 [Rhizophagus irregularis DAOM 181602=DAOM 197198]POG81917.1 hypothetical protein GLOIN_2v1088893 [Rhizophagus irregularis DAOM 181602=DAOM 197198]|eukprot:XP_025188783.1 hypothetical protein GLOIN_2v1088893 [Rhizophagus irregularis DAOM 181602=DAOM 197198]
MIFCFVVGTDLDSVFRVGGQIKMTVAELKDMIYEKNKNDFKDKKFDANKLNLWLVDIPYDTENVQLRTLQNRSRDMDEENIIQELGGEKLSPVDDIGDIFRYDSKNIRIIVQPPPPATTVPSTRTISLAQIEKEVQDLFKIHSQDLEKVVTNKYDPYKYFEAPYDHPYKSEIDKKKIPMLGGNPNLLLYNLPRKNKDYLTNCVLLELDL